MSPETEEVLRPNLHRSRGGRCSTPTVLQMEATECGAAALGMILAYHGRWVPLEELRLRCGVSRDGSNASSLLRAARQYGLVAQGFRQEPEDIFKRPFPMVVFWRFNHFLVLEGIRGDTVYVNDPAQGPTRMSLEEFDEGFTGVCLAFHPTSEFRKDKKMPGALTGVLSRLGATRWPLAFIALATLALIVPGLALPALTKVFVDDVLIQGNGSWVAPLLFGLGITAVMRSALTWLQQTFLARMEIKIALVQTTRFFWHVVTLPMAFFSQRYAGDIAHRVTSNDRVASLLAGQLATNAINVLTMMFYAAAMMLYDLQLTLVVFGMAVANLLALHLASRARVNSSRRLLKEEGKIAAVSVNGIHIVETLKANGAEGDFFARWSGNHANLLAAQQELGLVTHLLNLVPPLLTTLSILAILGLGGLRILDGALTIGGLVAFQSLALSFSRPINGLVQFGGDLQTIRGDVARLDDVLKYTPDERAVNGLYAREDEPPAPARGFISLDRITFGYNPHQPPLIEDFTLTLRPGQRVALVGGSGSGKSTIAKLACGLLEPWSGEIHIDERNLRQISPSHFKDVVSYVSQEISLFEASVRDNVTLWDATVEERDLTDALIDAAVHGSVVARPGRYDTPVEEGGRNFSGGQRQRLEIARALASNPAVLVLDEATAALDPVTEIEIEDRIRRRGCTCLVIAHRVSTIRDADEIVVLDRGHIVQRGRHDELLAQDGPYRALVTAG